jgi:PKD repeat protein
MKLYKFLFYFLLLLAATSLLSCEDDDTAGPAPTAAFAVEGTAPYKVNSDIKFQNTSENAFSYLWSFGDGTVSIERNPTHTYTVPGDYTVTLEASGSGLRSLASQTVTVEATEFRMYFIDNDAAKVRSFLTSAPTQIRDEFDLSGFSFGLAYDAQNEQFYYSDDDNGVINRVDRDGSNEVEVASGLDGPRDIAVDPANNRLFVTERLRDQITEVNLSDNTTSAIYSVDDDEFFLLPVGLDLFDDYLYATAIDFDAETVWKGALDGSGIEKIINYSQGGFGYALEVDKENGRIYFDDNDTNTLLSAALDGSDIQEIGSTSDRSYGIAINNQESLVYWATRDGIFKQAGLDGSNESVLTDTGVDVRGIVLIQGE